MPLQRDKDSQPDTLNLWTNFAQQPQGSAEVAEQGYTHLFQSKRRLSDAAMLSLLRDWLLQDYVAAYARSLGATRIFRRCYWVDALGTTSRTTANSIEQASTQPIAGSKGRKKNALIPAALAPLVSLSQELAQESKPITLFGLLLEAGSSKRKEIRVAQNGSSAIMHTVSIPRESGIIAASWLEAAPTLLKAIEQTPAIFLLNPLGSTLYNQDDLAPLYQRAVPTELCLLVPHKQIEMHLRAAQHTAEQPLTALLRSDRWKTLPRGEEQHTQMITGFIDLLVAAMQRHFQLPIQSITFPVPAGPAHLAAAPFTLLFATRRQDSLVSMNDAICIYRRRSEEQSYRGILSEEWFVAQQHERLEQALQQLAQRIRQQGVAQRARRWPDLRQQLLLSNFGYFTQYEYDALMQQLLASKEVDCTWRQPGTTTQTERVPGNEDTLVWR